MLKQRILTAIVALTVLAVVLFVVPSVIARMVIAALLLAGAWEWGGFIFKDKAVGRLAYVAFVGGLMSALFLLQLEPHHIDVILKATLGWWFAALIWMFFFPTPVAKAITWLCGAMVLVPAWMALDILYVQAPRILLFTLLIVWAADIGAYFAGKKFGRVKLAPKISPGKSWEGVLGGLAAVMLLTVAGSQVLDIKMAALIPFCLAVALLSVVGDLTVSMFKRSADVKDSGSLFPGHGGVLDRIDSVTAAAPLFALALGWIGLQ